MARKKKRSAKQLANDRRLGRMAKARAKAKRGKKHPGKRAGVPGLRKKMRLNPHRKIRAPGAKRRIRAPTTKRKVSAKSHLWRVFRCRGKSVFWIYMDTHGKWNWTKNASKGILFATKEDAAKVAKGIAKKPGYAPYDLGVASRETTASQIAAQCTGGKA